jgi:hypothetical protein
VGYRSNRAAVIAAYRQEAADRCNRARDAHHDATEPEVPVVTGTLLSTLEKGATATPQSLAALVQIGGERAPYAPQVNDGRILKDGSFLPGHHFWEEGEQAGREEMRRR